MKDRIVKGGETLLLIGRLNSRSGFDDCGNEKRFVNIDATTGLIMILSRLVDTFSSRILYPMLLLSGNHSIAVV